MEFEFSRIIHEKLIVDFQEIYDYVKNEYESDGDKIDDKWDVYHYFGDNLDYFIEKIYDYKIDDNDDINYINDNVLELLWNEFGNWIEKQNL